MPKPLSQLLADLSVRAKSAEDAWDVARKEAHEKIVSRKAEARAAATSAVEKVSHEIKSAGDSAAKDWNALKAMVNSDMNALKAGVATVKHEHDVKRAENRAERLEWEAAFAVDFAIAAVEQAKLAVLEAADGRHAAEQARHK